MDNRLDQVVPARGISHSRAAMSVLTDMLSVRRGGSSEARTSPGRLALPAPLRPLQSFPPGRIRSRPVIRRP